jgi:hypothetical protein
MSDFRYHLAKYAGKASRLECPNCHRRDFVPYVDDTTGAILDKSCGRCNHESSCGYHLTPHNYFLQHPEARPAQEPSYQARPAMPRPQALRRIWELPRDLIQRSLRPDRPCNFLFPSPAFPGGNRLEPCLHLPPWRHPSGRSHLLPAGCPGPVPCRQNGPV